MTVKNWAQLIIIMGFFFVVLGVAMFSPRVATIVAGVFFLAIGFTALSGINAEEEIKPDFSGREYGQHHFTPAGLNAWCAICGQDERHYSHLVEKKTQ